MTIEVFPKNVQLHDFLSAHLHRNVELPDFPSKPFFYSQTSLLLNAGALSQAVAHFTLSTKPQTNGSKYLVHRIYRTCRQHIQKNAYFLFLMLPITQIVDGSCSFATHRSPHVSPPPENNTELFLLSPEDRDHSVAGTFCSIPSYCHRDESFST